MTDQQEAINIDKSDSPENLKFLTRRVKLPWKDLEPGDSFLVPLDFFTVRPNTKTPRDAILRARILRDLGKFSGANYRATGVHRRFTLDIHRETDPETGELLGMRVVRDMFDVVGIGNDQEFVRAHRNGVHSSQE